MFSQVTFTWRWLIQARACGTVLRAVRGRGRRDGHGVRRIYCPCRAETPHPCGRSRMCGLYFQEVLSLYSIFVIVRVTGFQKS